MAKYKDSFRSTAYYYTRYRDGYPESLFTFLRDKFQLTERDYIMDLGCGPGLLTIPLSRYVYKVAAIDPEPEMIREGKILAANNDIENISWILGSSEDLNDLSDSERQFKLVMMGRSFHWMDRTKTLHDLYQIIEPGGGIAIITNPSRGLDFGEDGQKAVQDVFRKYLGEKRRAGSGYYEVDPRDHKEYVRESVFNNVELWSDTWTKTTTVDEIIGSYLSTSMASPFVLGERLTDFEREMKQTLLRINPSGIYSGEGRTEAILAWK